MICLGLLLMMGGTAAAAPSTFEPLKDGVYVVRDDSGQWTRDMSLDITHQVKAEYQAKKVLDLSNVPDDVWAQTKGVRLSAHFGLRDYSWHDLPQENGLDEAFEIVVNGKVHTYPTNCGAPAWVGGKTPVFGWFDFILPKEEFTRGANEIVLRKAQADKSDDYLYLCIDTTVAPANSYVAFSGDQWTQEKLTIPGGNGEYMVRLLLITKELNVTAVWQPGAQDRLDDPAGLVLYRGSRRGEATAAGLVLQPGQSARMEWEKEAIDRIAPMSVLVEATGEIDAAWLDEQGKPGQAVRGPAHYFADLPAGRTLKPSGFVITAADQPVTLTKVTLGGTQSCHPVAAPVDMDPPMSQPVNTPKVREPTCSAEGKEVVFEDRGLRCRFVTDGGRLRLLSLHNDWTDCEMVRHPDEVALFLVEVDGKRYAGSRDFRLDKTDIGKGGLTATLSLDEPPLTATVRIGMDKEGLRMGLSLSNAGQGPVDFKLAFPHLAGLAVSSTHFLNILAIILAIDRRPVSGFFEIIENGFLFIKNLFKDLNSGHWIHYNRS